jgi:ankyrin repeat protein
MVRLLVGLGASLDAPAPSGSTPLSVAVCWEAQDATRLLLELGADPNQVGCA